MLTVQEAVDKWGKYYEIPRSLIMAIVTAESSGNPFAYRFEPGYRWTYEVERFAEKFLLTKATEENQQKTSWGAMQVMGAVAREYGFDGRFMTKLVDPEIGIDFGCKYLETLYGRYGSWPDAVSAYNQGSNRKDKQGKFKNQSYVDKVLIFECNFKKDYPEDVNIWKN